MKTAMAAELFTGVPSRIRLAFMGTALGAVAIPVLFGALIAKDEPLGRNTVVGCYTALNAPALDVRVNEIRIIDPERRAFSYSPEQSKVSYQLAVNPALQLTRQSDGTYRFEQAKGIGYFWPLLPTEGKNRNRIRHPEEYSGRFEVYSSDGQRVVYSRQAQPDLCS